MNDAVYQEFENLLEGRAISGPVLEIGVIGSQRPLLLSPVFNGVSRKVGIDLECGDFNHFEFYQMSANDMTEFSEDEFECVVCNAVLEHDKRFWETLGEIKRVTSPGGLIAIGVPSYSRTHEQLPYLDLLHVNHLVRRIFSGNGQGDSSAGSSSGSTTRPLWRRAMKRVYNRAKELDRGRQTPVIGVHSYPNDYYRFSPDAMRDVFFEGCALDSISEVLKPPRLIGIGRVK